jgi:hypothetical protein
LKRGVVDPSFLLHNILETLREKIMNKFDVTVTGMNYNKTFTNCKYKTKLIAMKAVMDLVRNVEKVEGELTATAKVVR